MQTFILTEEQTMIRDLAAELAQDQIRPRAEKIDHHAVFPEEGLKIYADAGLLTCMVPEAYGGAGLDYWSQLCVIEETAKECASTAWAVANIAEVAECLVHHGDAAQKELVLPDVIEGRYVVAAGIKEKQDVIAQPTEEGFILNGMKRSIPNADRCAWYLIAAQDGEQTRWFLIKNDSTTIQAKQTQPQLGMKGCALYDLSIKQCVVSADMELKGTVQHTRSTVQTLNMAAIAVGIAQGALREAIQYVNQRVQFGKTIAQFENTQQVLSQLLAKTEATRSLVWDAAYVKDSGEDCAYAAALAKIAACDNAALTTRKCVQFMGGYGYSREYPVERKMRDAKMTELLCGATERQSELVASVAVLIES